jgi:hypothetical protein
MVKNLQSVGISRPTQVRSAPRDCASRGAKPSVDSKKADWLIRAVRASSDVREGYPAGAAPVCPPLRWRPEPTRVRGRRRASLVRVLVSAFRCSPLGCG